MDRASWQELLTRWNAELLDTPDIFRDVVSEEAVQSGWLGYPPATDAQIADAEARIGKQLPPSYRAFLEVSNGWRLLGNFHWDVLPAERIEWFRVNNQDWIDAYTYDDDVTDEEHLTYELSSYGGVYGAYGAFKTEYLDALLEVSGIGDSLILLLNPEVTFPNGEWEAWDFCNWYPGAHRYQSFWDMMNDLHASFLDLKRGAAERRNNDDAKQ